jgi:hypothetical protein
MIDCQLLISLVLVVTVLVLSIALTLPSRVQINLFLVSTRWWGFKDVGKLLGASNRHVVIREG